MRKHNGQIHIQRQNHTTTLLQLCHRQQNISEEMGCRDSKRCKKYSAIQDDDGRCWLGRYEQTLRANFIKVSDTTYVFLSCPVTVQGEAMEQNGCVPLVHLYLRIYLEGLRVPWSGCYLLILFPVSCYISVVVPQLFLTAVFTDRLALPKCRSYDPLS